MTCFLLVGIVVMTYIGLAVRKIKKHAMQIMKKVDADVDAVMNSYDQMQLKANELLDAGSIYMSIPPSAHLMDALINFFAHIGAKELGKGGLGLDKEQAGRVTMARNGFNVAGQRLGDGMGLPGIVEKFGGLAGLAGGGGMGGMGGMGGPGGAQAGEGGLGQMLVGLLMNMVTGGGNPPRTNMPASRGTDNEIVK